MGNLKTENTSYPIAVDTATLIADVTDEVVAAHVNGPVSAVLAIENELGPLVKGTAADLVHRLAVNIHADGGLLRGASAPGSPPNVPHWFYNTVSNTLYVYNIGTASYDAVSTAAILASYIRTNVAATITAAHTFAPAAPGVPFVLGANAQGQTVTGLSADTTDLHHMDQDVLIASSPTFVKATLSQATGTAPLTVSSTTKVTNLNVDQLDGYDASQAPGANQIPCLNASSVLVLPNATHTINGVQIATVNSTVANATNAATAVNASGAGTAIYSAEAGMRIIRASIIGGSGEVTAGGGVSVVYNSTGVWTITFIPNFTGVPVVIVSAEGGHYDVAATCSVYGTPTASTLVVHGGDIVPRAYDYNFSLIAIGPK